MRRVPVSFAALLARWRNGTGRRALHIAQRPVPLPGGDAEVGKDCWGQIAQRAVQSDGVVVVLPSCQSLADVADQLLLPGKIRKRFRHLLRRLGIASSKLGMLA